MVERKTLLATLLIVIIAAVFAGYTVGLFSASSGETVTVTSSTTITEIQTITTTSTISAQNMDFPFHTAENDTLMTGRLFENGRLLLALSINGSVFQFGESVNITATLTNLTPEKYYVIIALGELLIYNNNGSHIWSSPEYLWKFSFGPPTIFYFELGPYETFRIPEVSNYWNLKGLQKNYTKITYQDQFVPEGTYTIIWKPGVGIPDILSDINPPLTLEFNVKYPPTKLITDNKDVHIVSQFKGWSTTELESYKVFTELRYSRENLDWLNIFTADPETGDLLKNIANFRLTIPDPIVNYRGYFWFVSINTEPDRPAMEAGLYSHSFYVNAINATIIN